MTLITSGVEILLKIVNFQNVEIADQTCGYEMGYRHYALVSHLKTELNGIIRIL